MQLHIPIYVGAVGRYLGVGSGLFRQSRDLPRYVGGRVVGMWWACGGRVVGVTIDRYVEGICMSAAALDLLT